MSSIDPGDLVRVAAGEAPPALQERVEAHARRDPATAAALRELKILLDVPAGQTPPADLIDRAVAAWASVAHQPPAQPWWKALRESLADLVFDTRAEASLAGFRSGDLGTQLGFAFPDGQLDLEIESEGDQLHILGSVLTENGQYEECCLVPATGAPLTTAIDEAGNFQIRCMPAQYRLHLLRADGTQIVCGPVELGER